MQRDMFIVMTIIKVGGKGSRPATLGGFDDHTLDFLAKCLHQMDEDFFKVATCL